MSDSYGASPDGDRATQQSPSRSVSALSGEYPSRETIESIAAWCDETFGPAGAYRVARRAREELKELIDETPGDEWTHRARIEAADVVIILLRTPGIWDAIEEKMAINRKRKWRLTGDGCGYHIPASAIEARQGGDGEAGSVHESAAPKADAQSSSEPTP